MHIPLIVAGNHTFSSDIPTAIFVYYRNNVPGQLYNPLVQFSFRHRGPLYHGTSKELLHPTQRYRSSIQFRNRKTQ
jgi:hypothetical protein